MTVEDIVSALSKTHPDDMRKIKRYAMWILFRRKINNEFYPAVHWVRSSRQYHWAGK